MWPRQTGSRHHVSDTTAELRSRPAERNQRSDPGQLIWFKGNVKSFYGWWMLTPYHAGGGACRMCADVGLGDESSPLVPADRLVHQSQSGVVQPVWINVLYEMTANTQVWSCWGRYWSQETSRVPFVFMAPQPVVTQDQLPSRSSSSSGTQTGDTSEPGETTRGQHTIHDTTENFKCKLSDLSFRCSYWVWRARWGGAVTGQNWGGSCHPGAGWRPRPPGRFERTRTGDHGLPEPPRPL